MTDPSQAGPALPRLALTAMEAPAALGVSHDFFREHIAGELRWVRRGRKKLVSPFEIPSSWERFESMDHGQNSATCWLLWAVDSDGNLIVCDEYYSPGLVSKHAPEILRRRKAWWEVRRLSASL